MHRRLAALFLVVTACAAVAQSSQPLTVLKTIPLPGVTGKFDHLLTMERSIGFSQPQQAITLLK